MVIEVERPAGLSEGQLSLINSQAQNILACCGRQFGKSSAAIIRLEEELRKPERINWWVSPTIRQSKRIFNRFIRYIADIQAASSKPLYDINRSDLTVKTWNGSEVIFLGTDRSDNIRGDAVHFAVCDEFSYWKPGVYENVVEPTFLATNGTPLIISTPNAVDDDFHRLYKAAHDWDDWDVFHYTSYHGADEAKRERLDKLRNRIPPTAFDREYLAKFVQAQGALIDPAWIKEAEWNGAGKIYIGVDNAMSDREGADYTAIVAIAVNNENITVIHANKGRWQLEDQVAKIERLAKAIKAKDVVIETGHAGGIALKQMMTNKGLRIHESESSRNKAKRFATTEARYYQGAVTHAINTDLYLHPEFRRDIQNFTGTSAAGEEDDFADALAHAVNHATANKSWRPDTAGGFIRI